MSARPAYDIARRLLHRELRKLHLRPVKRLSFQFDPFHEKVTSIRDFLFHISAKRVRKTSPECLIKTEVVNDRSEPLLNVILANGINVTFKTGNLSTLEIAEEFNNIVTRFDVPEEEPALKLKSAKKRR